MHLIVGELLVKSDNINTFKAQFYKCYAFNPRLKDDKSEIVDFMFLGPRILNFGILTEHPREFNLCIQQ